jgi:hypothetical protein
MPPLLELGGQKRTKVGELCATADENVKIAV